ncbi:TetR/AcrR family transcriptional regulator [Adlercreutzia sp. ZJ154]|uniref:TetR/AcrR family transcriptional regulator n=1 Tax=Adlercreutzia sp. ZJ154 TaxID=2709790 RepID=UPI0013EBBD5D|nr:TetR/AcrR family transcriptional regulator [Adlercreutzia sp. ZJ154]
MAKPNPEKRARTKQRLMDAYITLLKTDSENPITARAVIEQAAVNRSTFYEYFDNVGDLRRAVEDNLIETMVSTAQNALDSGKDADLADLVMNAYVKHEDLIGLFLSQQNTLYFTSRVKSVLMPLLANTLEEKVNPQKLPYVSKFVTSGLLGFYSHWYEDKQTLPIEELVPLARTLAFSCLNAVSDTGKNNLLQPSE